jgi:hypothetical protein
MFYFYTCVYCLVFHLPKPLLLSQEHLKGNSTYAQVVLKQFTLGTSPIAGAKIIGDSFLLSLPPPKFHKAYIVYSMLLLKTNNT